jgi:Ser/Thr protein kinase RdoA (MazF antagonist)
LSAEPAAILADFGMPAESRVTPVTVGLINRTYLIEPPGARFILQRVNPIFGPDVHLDIEAITAHLEAVGMLTPRLVRTTAGALYTRDAEGGVWRVLTYVAGRTVSKVTSEPLARAAGALVGRFHRAVSTLAHSFHFTRPGAHDTPKHLGRLAEALAEKRDHPRYAEVAEVGRDILARASKLPDLGGLPPRICHGDLKINNLVFDEALAEGRALLDLDTMGHLTLAVEMGDALRSWCNPAGEDEPASGFDAALFSAAVSGFAGVARGMLTAEEAGALVAGAETIALELASRFCADALYESYFGWDPSRFASRSEHNLVRARSQLAVAAGIAAQRPALTAAAARAFGA